MQIGINDDEFNIIQMVIIVTFIILIMNFTNIINNINS